MKEDELKELLLGEIGMAADAEFPEERRQHAESAQSLLDELIDLLKGRTLTI